MSAEGERCASMRAAMATAGAVLRPWGSSTMARGAMPISRSCSPMAKRYSSLQMSTGGAKRSASATRSAVSWRRLWRETRGRRCLG